MKISYIAILLISLLFFSEISLISSSSTAITAKAKKTISSVIHDVKNEIIDAKDVILQAIRNSIRYAVIGATIGILYESLFSNSPKLSFRPCAAGAVLGAVIGFAAKFENLFIGKELRELVLNSRESLDDALAAGVLPKIDDSDTIYDDLMKTKSDRASRHKRDVQHHIYAASSETPKIVSYHNYPYLVFSEQNSNPLSNVWLEHMYKNYNLLSSLITSEFPEWSRNARKNEKMFKIQKAFCEVENYKTTGRVVGRGMESGRIWGGSKWVSYLARQKYRIMLPDLTNTGLLELISANQIIGKDNDPSLSDENIRKIISGQNRPGDLKKAKSTFGIYYIENNQLIGFHPATVDLASIYHFVIYPKEEVNLSYLLIPGDESVEQNKCLLLENMFRTSTCFFVLNQNWFLNKYSVTETSRDTALAEMLESLQLGFDLREAKNSNTSRLKLHVLLGLLTPEGMYPEFVDSWVSLKSLYSYNMCGKIPAIPTFNECLDRQFQTKTDKLALEKSLGCGSPQAPIKVKDDSWTYPTVAKPFSACPAYYKVSKDKTVYFMMENFTSKERGELKKTVGSEWRENEPWEIIEKQKGSFIGGFEQRSQHLDIRVWYELPK